MNLFHLLYLSFCTFFVTSCTNDSDEFSNKHSNPVVEKKSLEVTTHTYSWVTDFDNYVKETMSETGIPGAAVVIIKDNEILLKKGYGVKTYRTKDSVDVHTVFRLASVSKGFASTLAGIMVQHKFFSWDDHVLKYLPKFSLKNPISTSALTIRHILSHTSGLPLHTFTNKIEEDVPYSTLRDHLCTVNCIGTPGSVFAYQNVIFSLIGDIEQAVTQKTYEQLLSEKVFQPLGMTDASDTYKGLLATKNLAQPHERGRGTSYRVVKNEPNYYMVTPAAGVNASISDMAQWLFALVGNREDVISQATLNQMFAPEINTPRLWKYGFSRWPELKKASYALGWRVFDYGGETLIYHGGYVRGYRSEVAVYPKDKVAIAILVNSKGKLANDGVEVFLDKYLSSKRVANNQ